MTPRYDAIVLGAGGAGSAALYHLARRGARVLGIDRFPPPHDRGSSHGETRVIRMAYFEHPDYVPLLVRAYALWDELEKRSGRKLYEDCGLLEVGPMDGEVVPGVLESARRHGLAIESLDAKAMAARFPGFRLPEGLAAVFERRAGYLLVEDCVRAHLVEAQRFGAELAIGAAALGWEADGRGVRLRTERGDFFSKSLVVTPGAWAPALLGGLGVPFEVVRKPLFWFRPRDAAYRGGPCFFYELPRAGAASRFFYGFPDREPWGLKVAEHSGGRKVEDPLALERGIDRQDRAAVEEFLSAQLPGAVGELSHHAVCLYTLTPDRHFVVDRHPACPQLVFACGLSGHGFKFTSVLGEVLADLALAGGTAAPIGFLGLGRFAAAT
jgi:sarcosine oxidase